MTQARRINSTPASNVTVAGIARRRNVEFTPTLIDGGVSETAMGRGIDGWLIDEIGKTDFEREYPYGAGSGPPIAEERLAPSSGRAIRALQGLPKFPISTTDSLAGMVWSKVTKNADDLFFAEQGMASKARRPVTLVTSARKDELQNQEQYNLIRLQFEQEVNNIEAARMEAIKERRLDACIWLSAAADAVRARREAEMGRFLAGNEDLNGRFGGARADTIILDDIDADIVPKRIDDNDSIDEIIDKINANARLRGGRAGVSGSDVIDWTIKLAKCRNGNPTNAARAVREYLVEVCFPNGEATSFPIDWMEARLRGYDASEKDSEYKLRWDAEPIEASKEEILTG